MTGENHANGYFQIKKQDLKKYNIFPCSTFCLLVYRYIIRKRRIITYSQGRHRHTNHKRGGQTHHFLGLAVGCPEFSLFFFFPSFWFVCRVTRHTQYINTCRLFTVRPRGSTCYRHAIRLGSYHKFHLKKDNKKKSMANRIPSSE